MSLKTLFITGAILAALLIITSVKDIKRGYLEQQRAQREFIKWDVRWTNIMNKKEYCNCEPRAVCGMKKYHPTEHNSFLIGRPVINYCVYCGKEKQNHLTHVESDLGNTEAH